MARTRTLFTLLLTGLVLVGCIQVLAACSKQCAPGYGRINDTCRPVVPAGGAGAAATADAGADSHEGQQEQAVATHASDLGDSAGSSASEAAAAASNDNDGTPGSAQTPSNAAGAQPASGGNDGGAGMPSRAADAMAAASGDEMAKAPAGPCAEQPEQSVCDGEVMHHCDGAGNSATSEPCMSEALCQIGSASGTCAQCAPGTFLCEGVQLQECSNSGQWMDKERCASEALCKDSAGACTEMVCTPNAKTCDASGNLLTCNADGSDFAGREACGVGLCDAGSGRCNRCMPNTKTCQGNSLMTCSADGQSETDDACSPRNECWTAACTGSSCQQSPKRASSRCEGSKYCDGLGSCVECTSDAHCSALDDDCNDGSCQNGTCRPAAKERGAMCRSGSGLCDRGTCRDVECFDASDCSGSGASCVDGECVRCGDRKLGPGEECDIGAPKKAGDQLASATYDEYSCDSRCERLYLYTPCTVDSGQQKSNECGGNRCIGQFCYPNAGCNGEGTCTLPNGKTGDCYGNVCFRSCATSADCPSGMTCGDAGFARICGKL